MVRIVTWNLSAEHEVEDEDEDDPLTWGPAQEAAAEDVDVEVVDGLSAVVAIVDDGAEPSFVHVFLAGYFLHDLHGASQDSGIFHIHDRRMVRARNHQNVNRRLRIVI